jgi:hypothetical protein
MNDGLWLIALVLMVALWLVADQYVRWSERRRVPRIDVTAIGKGAAHPRPQVQTRTFSVPGNEE